MQIVQRVEGAAWDALPRVAKRRERAFARRRGARQRVCTPCHRVLLVKCENMYDSRMLQYNNCTIL